MELHVTKRKGRKIVVLLDNDMRIVKPVYDYLKYQDQRDRAINTLIAYGNDLKAFWEFLSEFGYTYDEVSPKMIGEYKEYLMSEDDNIIAINKEGARTAKTINRMLSTLHGFYQYQADMQEIDNPLLMHEVNRPFNAFINVYSLDNWNGQKLMPFIKRWDIRGNKGELYPLTSHQFRATFVRELVKRKVPIAMIMKQYSHVSIEMTAHYLTLQEEEVKEIYSDMILSPESKIAGLRAKEIKGKLDDLFHGKTEDEIDDVITDLAKTMSFNPLPTGVCLYDFRRGNCTDGDGCFFYNCPNYITEVQFYPILKDELDLLEKEMARLKELGQEPAYQVQAVKYKYLKPLVESLEVQLNGKESVG